MNLIYHITSSEAALAARQSGEYRAESLASQGFIHFSQLHQVLGVANAFYKGLNDQVILVVDPGRLTSELKYEAPAHPSMAIPDPYGTAERSMEPSADHGNPGIARDGNPGFAKYASA